MKLRFLPIVVILVVAALWWHASEPLPNAEDSTPHHLPSASNQLPSASNTFLPAPETPTKNIIEDEEDIDGDLPEEIETRPLITGVTIPTPTTTPPSASSTPKIETSPSVDAPIAALEELSRSADQDQMQERLRGRRSAGSPPDTPPPAVSPLPTLGTPEPTPTPRPLLPRVSGQVRGYVMLPLMLPRARAAMDRQIEILLNSEVNDLYISALVDGTFGEDYEYLESTIRKLNTGSRTLTLALYLSSGPTMRRWNTTPVRTFFSQINPEDFRFLIFDDQAVRDEVKRIAARTKGAFTLNASLNAGNQNFVIVMLEDNLDYDSYRSMRSLVSKELGDTAVFVRNPCPRCFRGNDEDPQGDILELHEAEDLSRLGIGDGYTLDGVNVMYPGDNAQRGITVEKLKEMLDQSVANGLGYFGLWRAQRQGLGDQLIHPQDRNYEVATREHELLEIELLRHGLLPVISESVSTDESKIDSRLFEFPNQ